MDIDWSVVATIAAPMIALLVGAGLNHLLEGRPKLIAYLAHASSFKSTTPDGGSINVHTHSIVLRNNGRQVSKNIRLGHNILPDFQVYPDIPYTVTTLPGGSKEICIANLVPDKQITISYLYFPPTIWGQVNTHIESEQGPAGVINVLPQQQYPRWMTNILRFFVLVGFASTLYVLYAIISSVISPG